MTKVDVNEKKLKQMQDLANKKLDETIIVPVKLEKKDLKEIDSTFSNVKDFRELGEKITSPIDLIVDKASKVIEGDPVMDVSKELTQVNKSVQKIYREIIDNDGKIMKLLKALPLVGGFFDKLDEKYDDAKFNLKNIKGQIETIFDGFDISYSSLNKSIDMQKMFFDGLEENMSKVVAYKDYVKTKLNEFNGNIKKAKDEQEKEKYKMFAKNVEYFLGNLEVLIGNLELARKRLLIRMDAAVKLSLAMNSSRPIFKTLLSVAILETGSQKSIDAATKAMDVMGTTIDNMSKDLTDKAIQSSKKAEQMAAKPVLDTDVFIENVRKLKEHFDTIDEFREQVKKEAQEEKKLFDQATKDLKKIHDIKSGDFDELQTALKNPK